jgi:hypothetical protein
MSGDPSTPFFSPSIVGDAVEKNSAQDDSLYNMVFDLIHHHRRSLHAAIHVHNALIHPG